MGWEISPEPYLENTIFHKMKEMSKQQEAGITGSFIVQDLTLKHWTPTELPADFEQKPSELQHYVIQSGEKKRTLQCYAN